MNDGDLGSDLWKPPLYIFLFVLRRYTALTHNEQKRKDKEVELPMTGDVFLFTSVFMIILVLLLISGKSRASAFFGSAQLVC